MLFCFVFFSLAHTVGLKEEGWQGPNSNAQIPVVGQQQQPQPTDPRRLAAQELLANLVKNQQQQQPGGGGESNNPLEQLQNVFQRQLQARKKMLFSNLSAQFHLHSNICVLADTKARR